jgi:hypothetical protein
VVQAVTKSAIDGAMDGFQTTSVGVTAGLIAVVVPMVLRALGQASSVEPGRVAYGRTQRGFAAVMSIVPPLGVLALAFAKPPSSIWEVVAIAMLALFFPALSLPLLLEFTRVAHRYDDRGCDFVSPWSRRRRLEWSEVEELKWRPTLKWLDFHASDARPFHFSPMLGGLEDFATVALASIHPAVLERNPEPASALRLMATGNASALGMSHLPPSQLWRQLLEQVQD